MELKKKNKFLKLELLLYIAYALMLFTKMFAHVYLLTDDYKDYIEIISNVFLVAYLAVKLIRNKYDIKSVVIGFAIIALMHNNASNLAYLLTFVFAMYENDKYEFLKVDLFLRITYIFTVVILSLNGLAEMNYKNFIDNSGNYYPVYSYGFSHPNTLGFYIFVIFCLIIYIYHDKLNIIFDVGLAASFAYADMKIIHDRTAFMGIILVCCLSVVYRLDRKRFISRNRILRFVFSFSFIALCGLSFFMAFNYKDGNEIWIKLNSLMSTRISLMQAYFHAYKISFFGVQNLYTHNSTHFPKSLAELGIDPNTLYSLDNGYSHLLIRYGVCGLGIFAMLFTYALHKNFLKDKILFAIILVMCITGVLENAFYLLDYNPFLICLADFLDFPKNSKLLDKIAKSD